MKFHYLNRWEKISVILLSLVFFVSTGLIFKKYISSISEIVPASGGVYSEGLVGNVQFINPLFSNLNPIDGDISSLVFSGLMKYNPLTGNLEDDIALHSLDTSKRIYTFTLKNNVFWHDGTPVTANDIIFTFKDIIQNPNFKNNLLRENFKGVEIKKINDTTVTFTLDEPYKFFLTNLTVGLVPEHILKGIPAENLHLSEFNTMSPIGTGPYQVVSIAKSGNAVKVALTVNEKYYGKKPFLTGMNFYLFPNIEQLLLSKNLLDGVGRIDKSNKDFVNTQTKFPIQTFTLPQYVAAFLNTSSPLLQNKGVRLGLTLGTDKESILKTIKEEHKVDTPFLELNTSHWLLHYDAEKAQGALSDASWKLPWKQEIKKTPLLTSSATVSAKKYFTAPNSGNNFATSEENMYLEGTVPDGTQKVQVNDYTLGKFNPEKKTFSYRINKPLGTLKDGENLYTVLAYDAANKATNLGTFKIFFSTDTTQISTKQKEYDDTQKIVEKPKEVKTAPAPTPKNEASNQNTKYRINQAGEALTVHILTSKKPEVYKTIAEELQKSWEKIGVNTVIETLDTQELQKRVGERKYDVLIFGQSLGYNLDSYPYWHSSQAKTGFNFSVLSKFSIDSLLEEIRSTHDDAKRQKKLESLESQLTDEAPAIFFYAPENAFAISPNVMGVKLGNLRDARDRFAGISNWYTSSTYAIKPNISIFDFFTWLFENLFPKK